MAFMRRAAIGVVCGVVVGSVLYIVSSAVNAALGYTLTNSMLMAAIGLAASVAVQLLKEEEGEGE